MRKQNTGSDQTAPGMEGSERFDILIIMFLKEFFENVNLKNSTQTTTKHEKLSSMQ